MEEVRRQIKSDAEGLETLYVRHDFVYSRYPRSVVETHPQCAVGCGEDRKISLLFNHATDVQKAAHEIVSNRLVPPASTKRRPVSGDPKAYQTSCPAPSSLEAGD